jgi:hypothetical protein
MTAAITDSRLAEDAPADQGDVEHVNGVPHEATEPTATPDAVQAEPATFTRAERQAEEKRDAQRQAEDDVRTLQALPPRHRMLHAVAHGWGKMTGRGRRAFALLNLHLLEEREREVEERRQHPPEPEPASAAAPAPSGMRGRIADDAPAADEDGPPVIRLGVDIAANADEAIRALVELGDVYQRDTKLVHVTRVSRQEEIDASVTVDGVTYRPLIEGTPRIRDLPIATLRENLSTLARWERFDSRSKIEPWKPALPSGPVVAAVHARGVWCGVRRLVAVSEAPHMRPDGAIWQTPGYDPLTGFAYLPSLEFPRVPDCPTREDATKALALLRDVFSEFPFVTSAQALVPIAAIMTILVRPAITGACPAFTVDASARGSGKTLCTDAIAIIATGRDAARLNFPTRSFRSKSGVHEVPNEEELEKILGACALSGARLVCFDNIVCEFGGAPLDKALTARDSVQFRILGASEAPVLAWRGVILGCGNNLALGPDTVRRVLPCRIESNTANPEAREGFKHDKGSVMGAAALVAFVREKRPALVAAALTIARAYVVAGRPEPSRLGSFDEWAALVPSALRFADPSVNVLDARVVDEADVSDSTAALLAVLTLLPEVEAAHARLAPELAQGTLGAVAIAHKRGITAADLVTTLYPDGKRPASDALDALRNALEELTQGKPGDPPAAKAVGTALKRHVGRVLTCNPPDGEPVDRRLDGKDKDRNKVVRWRVETLGDVR